MTAFAELLKQRNEFYPRPRNFKELGRLPEWIQEECGELIVALTVFELDGNEKALAEIVDGIMDIIYYAMGGLVSLGQSHEVLQQCWDAVHQANMRKTPNDDQHKLCFKGKDFKRPNELMEEIVDVEKFVNASGRL